METTAPASRPGLGAPAPIVPMIVDLNAEAARAEQDAASRTSEKEWEAVLVPAESVIGLQLESSISSEFARVEDRVDARVTRDVRVGSRVAIPAGTRAIGTVVLVERGGRVKERARLGLRFTTLILPDTTRLTINTETIYREGESPAGQSTAKIGGATIGGAILGAILGGGKGAAIGSGIGAAGGTAAAMNGDRMPVSLPAGTPLSVRTQAPINMTVEK
jgi:type IV secretory pathway VirB10-like protein